MGTAVPDPSAANDAMAPADPPGLAWPFETVNMDADDLREAAYEIFFTACRAAPGFVGRTPLSYIGVPEGGDGGRAATVPTSRIKRTLGLKPRRTTLKKLPGGGGGGRPQSPVIHRRPFTTAELMRQQMRVSEQNDGRLRQALMRILVGQMGRRSETIILPMELLRQLKPSEFSEPNDYHHWQIRHLRLLELGLVTHPFVSLDKSSPSALKLKVIVKEAESKPIDTSKSSEAMRDLCNLVAALSSRTSPNGSSTDTCHWVDGYPLNLHLYVSLLRSCFDVKDDTAVIEEVDEVLELMKKTWTTLGINKLIHNVCFTWVLFNQFLATGQTEQDLLTAGLSLLSEVMNDAKKAWEDPLYAKIMSSALSSIQSCAEKWLLDYHESFKKSPAGFMEKVLSLALSTAKILHGEDAGGTTARKLSEKEQAADCTGSGRVESYIRSSARNAFAKLLESKTVDSAARDNTATGEEDILLVLANDTEDLAQREKDIFSPVLKKWHPSCTGIAVITFHNCYGVVLKQYVSNFKSLTTEAATVLHRAEKLEKNLVQMVADDAPNCKDGGKGIVKEMVPYETQATMNNLLKRWVDGKLATIGDNLIKIKEAETWNPKSKSEPYGQSAVELVKMSKECIEHFFETPVTITEELVHHLCEGLDAQFQEYAAFVSACGSKQNYMPSLPPLTRCNQGSTWLKAVRKVTPCQSVGDLQPHQSSSNPDFPSHGDSSTVVHHYRHHQPRPSTSRGTQRFYIRLNTLHYLLSQIHSLHKSVRRHHRDAPRRLPKASSHFDLSRATITAAARHVAEVSAYRLIFLDSSNVLYDGLYIDSVADARIRPAIRALKQNLSLLTAITTGRAREGAIREIIKASFDAFLMVLLAGGRDRAFQRDDVDMVREDFWLLKQVLVTSGGEAATEEVVDREAEAVRGVLELMAESSDQLIESFSVLACEYSGSVSPHKVPMPPTTGRWNRLDPNTILRVLCHRNDKVANNFLKKNFQMARRR